MAFVTIRFIVLVPMVPTYKVQPVYMLQAICVTRHYA